MKKTLCVCLAIILCSLLSLKASATSNVYSKNENAKMKVALSFDDGPHPIYTERILEILEKYGVKATFFVIGQNVENYPSAFLSLAESENEIGNHTFSHSNVGRMSEEELRGELEKTERAIAKHTNRRSFLFRPPEGYIGSTIEKLSLKEGYDIVLWSIDTLDWAHTPAQKMVAGVISELGDGDIILMHDYTSHGAHTCEALEMMIPLMLKMGYEFVTVGELICEE